MEIRPSNKKIIDLKHPQEVEAELVDSLQDDFFNEVFIEWQALEYEHSPKSKNWFIWSGVIVGVLVIFSLFTKNYLFAILLVVLSFVVWLYSIRPPKELTLAITHRGVMVGNRVFPFEDLKSFWIFYEADGLKDLSIESKKAMMPYIRVSLGDTDPVRLRNILLRFIPERQHEESLAEALARLIGL